MSTHFWPDQILYQCYGRLFSLEWINLNHLLDRFCPITDFPTPSLLASQLNNFAINRRVQCQEILLLMKFCWKKQKQKIKSLHLKEIPCMPLDTRVQSLYCFDIRDKKLERFLSIFVHDDMFPIGCSWSLNIFSRKIFGNIFEDELFRVFQKRKKIRNSGKENLNWDKVDRYQNLLLGKICRCLIWRKGIKEMFLMTEKKVKIC